MLFKESGVINLLTLHVYTCRRSSALAFCNTIQDPVHQLSGQNSWFVKGKSGFKFEPGDQIAWGYSLSSTVPQGKILARYLKRRHNNLVHINYNPLLINHTIWHYEFGLFGLHNSSKNLSTNKLYEKNSSANFMGPEGSLPCSQEPVTCPHSEPGQSNRRHPNQFLVKFHLTLSYPLCLCLPNGFFPFRFPLRDPVCTFLLLLHMSYIPSPSHSSWSDHLDNTLGAVQIIKFLTVYFPPVPCWSVITVVYY
jgi:hypothetical protein